MTSKAQFQMLVLDLYLVLLISSTPDFNLVLVFAQDLIFERTTVSEDFRRCCVQYKRKYKILFNWLIFFITILSNLVLWHFGSVKSLE